MDRAQLINTGGLASASGVDVAESFVELAADHNRFIMFAFWLLPLAALLVGARTCLREGPYRMARFAAMRFHVLV